MASSNELIYDYYNTNNKNLNTNRNYDEIVDIIDRYNRLKDLAKQFDNATRNSKKDLAKSIGSQITREFGITGFTYGGNAGWTADSNQSIIDDYIQKQLVENDLESYGIKSLDEANQLIETTKQAQKEMEKESAAAKAQLQGLATAQKEQTKKDAKAQEQGIVERVNTQQNTSAQGRIQGLGRGVAASIGSNIFGDYNGDNYQKNYGNLSALGQSTQNDYLQKMGYVNALNQQADNISKGSFANIIGSIFQGAGAGASVGGAIGGSIK